MTQATLSEGQSANPVVSAGGYLSLVNKHANISTVSYGSATAVWMPTATQGRSLLGPFLTGGTMTITATGGALVWEVVAPTAPNPQSKPVFYDPATGSLVDGFGAPVSGAGNSVAIASSRNALLADNGGTFELASGVTYTLTDAVALSAGVTLMGPVSGTATLACTGTATINAGTSSVSITAGQVYAAIPRATTGSAYLVKGS